jgi:membrane protease YdiL (CAAX protease family)
MRALPDRPLWIGVGGACGLVSGALALGYLQLLKRLGVSLPEVSGASRIAIGVMAVGLAPLAEEIFFRGWLFPCIEDELSPGRRRWLAPLICAFAFAAVHPPLSFVPVFALGVVTSLLFARTRALGPAIAAHLFHNGLAVLFAASAS